jgi:hypothetical protein
LPQLSILKKVERNLNKILLQNSNSSVFGKLLNQLYKILSYYNGFFNFASGNKHYVEFDIILDIIELLSGEKTNEVSKNVSSIIFYQVRLKA